MVNEMPSIREICQAVIEHLMSDGRVLVAKRPFEYPPVNDAPDEEDLLADAVMKYRSALPK